jgi:dUTPase
MLVEKVLPKSLDVLPSKIYPNCMDIFNMWENLYLEKGGSVVLPLGMKIVPGFGTRCVITDRYGFCAENRIYVENKAVRDNFPVCVKVVNQSGTDIVLPHGVILCQVMVIALEMVGR